MTTDSLVGNRHRGALSWWGIVLMGSCPGEGVVQVGNCPGGGLS